MEKNTIIAVILCVIVISAGYFVQAIFFPVEEPQVVQQDKAAPAPEEAAPAAESEAPVQVQVNTPPDTGSYQDVEVETDVFSAVLTTKGGAVKSIRLKAHDEKDKQPLEMIYRNESQMNAFELYFNDINSQPLAGNFAVNKFTRGNDTVVEFKKDVNLTVGSGNSVPVEIKKTYTFKSDEYMVELAIEFTS